MKRYVFIGILCLLSLHGMAEYYYYHGEKVTININTDSVVVYTPSMIKSDNPISKIHPTTIDRNQATQLALNDSTHISAIGYIIGDTVTRKMSNCFYVKLYEDADTVRLKDIVKETRTLLLGQVPHMDKWYKIMIDHSVINNSLEMSNYFYETGLFADIDPGFVFEFKPSCVGDYKYFDQWSLPVINSCEAWGETTGSSYITVAVVDQGIELNHREFSGTSFASYAYDCYEGVYGLYTTEPYGNHGTMVASVIAANHNYGNMAGLAPRVSILPISHPLSSENWNIAADLASGISWAVNNGVDVINCSWGDHGGAQDLEHLHSTILENSIQNALTNGRYGKGCIVIFAAGNNGVIDYPANFTSELLVCGSINDWYQKAEGSGCGQSLDVVAPGDSIYMADLGNSYSFDYGTSFAAPHVSAIAALVLSINSDLTREEVTNIIEISTQKINGDMYPIVDERINGKWNTEIGYGLVDAYAAVLSAQSKYIQNQTYQLGDDVYEYATNITAGSAVTNNKRHGNVVLESGSDVILRAMDRIILKNGFHAKSGSKLHVVTDRMFNNSSETFAQATSTPQRIAPNQSVDEEMESSNEMQINNDNKYIEYKVIVSTSIYTISGQLLQTFEGNQNDISNLPNGMYILQYRMNDGGVRSEKIAITK